MYAICQSCREPIETEEESLLGYSLEDKKLFLYHIKCYHEIKYPFSNVERSERLQAQIKEAKEFFEKRDALFSHWNETNKKEMLSTYSGAGKKAALDYIEVQIRIQESAAVRVLYNLLWALGEFESPMGS